mgnify:CR=1 FL=1
MFVNGYRTHTHTLQIMLFVKNINSLKTMRKKKIYVMMTSRRQTIVLKKLFRIVKKKANKQTIDSFFPFFLVLNYFGGTLKVLPQKKKIKLNYAYVVMLPRRENFIRFVNVKKKKKIIFVCLFVLLDLPSSFLFLIRIVFLFFCHVGKRKK